MSAPSAATTAPPPSLISRIRRDNRQQLAIALSHTLLMGGLATLGNWPVMRMALAFLCLVRASAAYRIWRHDQAITALQQSRGACTQILDAQRRFVLSVKFWYTWPLALGVMLAGVAFLLKGSWMGAAFCTAAAAVIVVGGHQVNDVRWIRELDAARGGAGPSKP